MLASVDKCGDVGFVFREEVCGYVELVDNCGLYACVSCVGAYGKDGNWCVRAFFLAFGNALEAVLDLSVKL